MRRALLLCLLLAPAAAADSRPNILFVFTDDHASHAISAYGSKINQTPNIDRLAREGVLFRNCFCTNSICAPSRAVILTGKHSHRNGVVDNSVAFDGKQQHVGKLLGAAGYQTALIGKWHLKSDPTGFDYWAVLSGAGGQGTYYNPQFKTSTGPIQPTGYCTDLTTDMALDWIGKRDPAKPFFLLYQHKAPHRSWEPGPKQLGLYRDAPIPEPATLFDDHAGLASPARHQEMTVASHLSKQDLKLVAPKNLTADQKKAWDAAYAAENAAFEKAKPTGNDLVRWQYQRYIKDYLRCVAGVDDNLGRVLKYLDDNNLAKNTIVVYSSDQGFFLGDRGWYDKRWMYDESLRMPLLVRWPGVVKPGTEAKALVQNLDFAQTFLAAAGVKAPADMQGASLVPVLKGETPKDWRQSIYYHYFEYPGPHSVARHYGVRTHKHKLIHYYRVNEWELFDLEKDPGERKSVYADPAYAADVKALKAELDRLRKHYRVEEYQEELPKRGDRSRRPNVVLIMTDDQGYGDLGCHGNKVVRTPHLDKLHAESVRLTNFHVDPTCSPTRSALLTGRYSSRTGVWHTIMGRSLLRRDEQILPQLISADRTGVFGKWHLGDNYPFRPQDRGWGRSLVHGGGGIGQTPDAWGNTYFDDTYLRDGKPEKQTGYCTDVFFDAARRFITDAQNGSFVCYIATNAPHAPYHVPPKYSKAYRDRGVPAQRANFYGMIENIDENVGKLMQHLRDLKLDQNTLVVFLTDNGTAAGYTEATGDGFNAGMRGIKGSAYEGGHRVPCFLHWPGTLRGGRDIPQLTAHIDLLPTLVDLTGGEPTYKFPIDGRSLRPLLEGRGAWPERTLFVHSQRIEQPERWRQCAVMTSRWRLIDGKELYDLPADPGQRADVAAKHPAVVSSLRSAYEKWYTDISPRFSEYCEVVVGTNQENPATLTGHDWHGPAVPWNHAAIKKLPVANGFWAVEVARAGRYQLTLRHQPAEAKCPLRATTARVKLGDVEAKAAVPAGATAVTLEVTVDAGKTRLQTWLDDGAVSRGAFYVEVRRVD